MKSLLSTGPSYQFRVETIHTSDAEAELAVQAAQLLGFCINRNTVNTLFKLVHTLCVPISYSYSENEKPIIAHRGGEKRTSDTHLLLCNLILTPFCICVLIIFTTEILCEAYFIYTRAALIF